MAVVDHALLLVALLALATAGSRAGAALGGEGVLRALAAAPIAATAAGLAALGLGLLDLGSDPPALTLAAGGTWLLARSALARPARPLWAELGAEWSEQSPSARVAAGAFVGIVVALAAWFLANPGLTGDGLIYHLPIVAAWVTGGDPPALVPIATDVPLEAYPLTNELLLTWASGIARSFVPVTLWTPAILVLLALAAWWGLRRLDVPELVSVLAVAALVTSPLLVRQLNTFVTDLPALAWLVCCAALCLGSVRAPGLLVAALLAAALAVGTKTTTLPLALVCLLAALVASRWRLRALAAPLAFACLAGALVGGLWYARNLILHGSPLWPFASTSWGDPLPFALERSEALLWNLSSAQGRLDDYARFLYGDLVLLVGGLIAPLLLRSPRVLAASAATAFAIIVWANAPGTGYPLDPFYDGLHAGATRYLTPAIASGTLAIALAGTGSGLARDLATALLALTLLANLAGDATLGFVGEFDPATALDVDPMLPSVAVPVAGAAIGAAAVLALSRAGWGWLPRPGPASVVRPTVWVLGVVLAGALLALTASGYVERSTRLESSPPGAAWLVRQPDYADRDDPVAMQNRTVGTLAGNRLDHRLNLIPAQPECGRIRDAARDGWVILSVPRTSIGPEQRDPELAKNELELRAGELAAARCLADRDPSYGDHELRIFAPEGG